MNMKAEGLAVEFMQPSQGKLGWVCGFMLGANTKSYYHAHKYVESFIDHEACVQTGQPLLLRERGRDRCKPSDVKNKALAKKLNIGEPEGAERRRHEHPELDAERGRSGTGLAGGLRPPKTRWLSRPRRVRSGPASSDASSRRPAGAGSTLPVICFLLAVFVFPLVLIGLYSVNLLTNLFGVPTKFSLVNWEELPAARRQRLLGPLQDLDGHHPARLGAGRGRRVSARVLPRLRRAEAALHAAAPHPRALLHELSAARDRVEGDPRQQRRHQLGALAARPARRRATGSAGSSTPGSRSRSSSSTPGCRSSHCRSTSSSRTWTGGCSRRRRTSAPDGCAPSSA